MSPLDAHPASSPCRLLHVITGLEVGGAETMLTKLVAALQERGFDQAVVSLLEEGPLGAPIRARGIPVHSLAMRRGLPDPLALAGLVRLLRRAHPDLIQTWMYHADLMGGVAARFASGVPVVWGIRGSNLDPRRLKPATFVTSKLCAGVSGWLPAHILCCSESALEGHARAGYRRARMSVIPNGFDVERFRPDESARTAVRAELGLPPNALLIGLVGRFDPEKDHETFVRAAGALAPASPGVHFVLCGFGVSRENPQLDGWIRATGRPERFHAIGLRRDMPRIHAALDLAVSSSISEGFPNVIGEAMACAIPCVVTDVGDSARIVGDTGWVVPPSDPNALARAMRRALELPSAERRERGSLARRRIVERWSLARVAEQYRALYLSVLRAAS